jgi:hypothetical protein
MRRFFSPIHLVTLAKPLLKLKLKSMQINRSTHIFASQHLLFQSKFITIDSSQRKFKFYLFKFHFRFKKSTIYICRHANNNCAKTYLGT